MKCGLAAACCISSRGNFTATWTSSGSAPRRAPAIGSARKPPVWAEKAISPSWAPACGQASPRRPLEHSICLRRTMAANGASVGRWSCTGARRPARNATRCCFIIRLRTSSPCPVLTRQPQRGSPWTPPRCRARRCTGPCARRMPPAIKAPRRAVGSHSTIGVLPCLKCPKTPLPRCCSLRKAHYLTWRATCEGGSTA